MDSNREDVKELLLNIKYLNERYNNGEKRKPTHHSIWAGSYDVWSCEQDRIDAIEIPKARMKEAEEAGFIKNEIINTTYKNGKTFAETLWSLTELGEQYLINASIS